MQKFLYESKPFIMLAVAILAIIQIDDKSSVFEISGYVLLAAGLWIILARLKYRGYIKKGDPSENEDSPESNP